MAVLTRDGCTYVDVVVVVLGLGADFIVRSQGQIMNLGTVSQVHTLQETCYRLQCMGITELKRNSLLDSHCKNNTWKVATITHLWCRFHTKFFLIVNNIKTRITVIIMDNVWREDYETIKKCIMACIINGVCARSIFVLTKGNSNLKSNKKTGIFQIYIYENNLWHYRIKRWLLFINPDRTNKISFYLSENHMSAATKQ